MTYARIPLNFETMRAAYKNNKQLPADIGNWLKEVNTKEDEINAENAERKARGEDPLPGGGHSTSCCMQVSLSFNATGQSIPRTGTRVDRDNLTLNGKSYVLTVAEFRAYLTYKYGPTDVVADVATIKGKNGVLLFGNGHIELWDGDNILQKPGTPGAMDMGWVWGQKPVWFWEIGEQQSAAVVPEWLIGWWTVWDGSYYYYYFYRDGSVCYIETRPNTKWVPPKTVGTIGNHGKVTSIDNGFHIEWNLIPTETLPTREDFIRRYWTSETEMNGTSNKYSPLVAQKMN